MSKIKIVHIITGFNQGGAETALYRLISNLTPLKYEITVISLTGPGFYSDKILELNLPIYYLRMNKFNCIAKLFILAGILKKIKPDIVHTWMYHANLLGGLATKLKKKKKIIWGIRNNGDMLKFSTRLVLRLNAYFSGWIPVSIVCCSMRAIDNHIKKGFPENKICYIPNGFNTETFTPSSLEQKCALRKQYGLSSKKVLLGMMARYDDQKDYPNLLRAFAILSQQNDTVFLIMCGKGLNKENHVLTKLIESLQLQSRVQMIDGVDQPVDIYQMLDFFVLSSRTEGFPNVVGEAMSCGLPCVVTDVGDAAYLVNNGGDVVAKERPDFLAQACQKMLALSSEEMAELGAQARAKIMGNFSLESTVNQYVKLYEG